MPGSDDQKELLKELHQLADTATSADECAKYYRAILRLMDLIKIKEVEGKKTKLLQELNQRFERATKSNSHRDMAQYSSMIFNIMDMDVANNEGKKRSRSPSDADIAIKRARCEPPGHPAESNHPERPGTESNETGSFYSMSGHFVDESDADPEEDDVWESDADPEEDDDWESDADPEEDDDWS